LRIIVVISISQLLPFKDLMAGLIIVKVSSFREMIGHGLGDSDSIPSRGRNVPSSSRNCLALPSSLWRSFPRRERGQSMDMTTYMYLVPRLESLVSFLSPYTTMCLVGEVLRRRDNTAL
jgi:hypothetical protein